MVFLQTDRLTLRNLESKDFDIMYSYRNDFNCAQYQSWNNAETSHTYLKKFIEDESTLNFSCRRAHFAIALSSNDMMIGELFFALKNKTITLGYTISPENQRKGYAYELLSELIDFLSSKFTDHEFVCLIHPNNKSSINLIKKLNFKEECYSPEIDSLIYSLKI